MDMLVEQTHAVAWGPESADKPIRYTDTLLTEEQRGLSLKSTPMTLVLPDSREKSYLVNLMDSPGREHFLCTPGNVEDVSFQANSWHASGSRPCQFLG